MTEASTILDLDSLLDATMDNVEDVPDYVTPPSGNYMLQITDAVLANEKGKDDKMTPRFTITIAVKETLELANPSDMPVANDSLFSERFQATEEGQKYFKRAAKNYLGVSTLDGVSIRDILASLKDSAPFKATITQVESESDGKKYTNLRIRVAPPTA